MNYEYYTQSRGASWNKKQKRNKKTSKKCKNKLKGKKRNTSEWIKSNKAPPTTPRKITPKNAGLGLKKYSDGLLENQ